ncbi:MAG TPA: hypothetical protein VFS16_12450 [Acidimicrobiia bacterium]|nr:hypothetical protein [Acidimicrobiia bacterium]
MGQKNDPHYGEQSGQEPHMGETEEPEGTGRKSTSTGTGTAEETGTDADDAGKAGMRPTGSGGSAPMTENM